MNQKMKDEIKVLTVAATLENGFMATEKLKNLHTEIEFEINKIDGEEITKNIDAWTNVTNYTPEEVGFKFMQAMGIFENTEIGSYIDQQKKLIDQELTNQLNELDDLYDDFEMTDKLNLARIHVINFSKKYQELVRQINEAMK